MVKKLLTGNVAVARGAWEAGVRVVSAYPGTPSTEITEYAATYEEIYAEWAPNEKVAVESAIGASIGGARALAAMKHVGLNVAADPLFTVGYTGVNGGLVIVTADDPGMHSSQNEQDNRLYGRAAKVPVLEPSDSQEAKDFTKLAFAISEQFDTPVLLRLTTRISHSQSLVELGERQEKELAPYEKNAAKYVAMPANARKLHVTVEERLKNLAAYSETTELNRVEWGKDRKLGIIASGAVYQYVKEALPDVSVLKIGMAFPLPKQLITDFVAGVEKVVVIEELETFMEDTIKSWGIAVTGKALFSPIGEIFTETIKEKILGEETTMLSGGENLPNRPPVLCPGCPHRGIFYVLHKLKLNVSGDIGCYTLAAVPPLNAMDTTICMGASIGVAHGMEKARGKDFSRKTVAVLGDSTFLHSGITGLINTVYNGSTVTTIILDNSITAMTGHQQNPATGKTAKGEPAPSVDLEAMVRACGVKRVRVVDPFDLAATEQAVREEIAAEEPSVIITKRPCILINRAAMKKPLVVEKEKCINCGICLGVGCPAIARKDGKAKIDVAQCVGCGVCASVCPKDAIVSREKDGE